MRKIDQGDVGDRLRDGESEIDRKESGRGKNLKVIKYGWWNFSHNEHIDFSWDISNFKMSSRLHDSFLKYDCFEEYAKKLFEDHLYYSLQSQLKNVLQS